ncbi:hypothetical protein IG631_04226 [Alternaria alternata]|nr:hypothetical protein IG631_04226 [Alternaria alternata]
MIEPTNLTSWCHFQRGTSSNRLVKACETLEHRKYERKDKAEASLEALFGEAGIRRKCDANSDEVGESMQRHGGRQVLYRDILVDGECNWSTWADGIRSSLDDYPRRFKIMYCCSMLSVLLMVLIFWCHCDRTIWSPPYSSRNAFAT